MLEVVHGVVPRLLPGAVDAGPVHQAAPGRALLQIPGVARVLVEDGRRAVVEPHPAASAADVTWLMRGPARQVGWLQRGMIALRAASVAIGGRAVVLVGRPAAGKSAVAAALATRGHAVLADSALPVGERGSGSATAVSDELELWPPVVAALGLDPGAGRVVRPQLAKRAHRFAAAQSCPVAAIVALERRARQDDPVAEQRSGVAAAQLVGRFTAMAPLLDGLGLRAAHLSWAARLAAEAPVYHLRVDRHRHDLAAVADAVEVLVP